MLIKSNAKKKVSDKPYVEQLDPKVKAQSQELQQNAQGIVDAMALDGKPLDENFDEFIEKMEDQRATPGSNFAKRSSKYFFGWSPKNTK